MPKVILLGDAHSHGGKVVQASGANYTVNGVAVALKGDACTCPQQGHQNCTIAEGNPNDLYNGIPVAYDGCKTSCGATLIGSSSAIISA